MRTLKIKMTDRMAFIVFVMVLTVCLLLTGKYAYREYAPVPSSTKMLRNTPVKPLFVPEPGFAQAIYSRGSNKSVPKTIYMLWDKGFDNAPPLQATCLQTVKLHNQDFTIYALNMEEAEALIDRPVYYPDATWQETTTQAKSDIIRAELLAEHGGVWMDATVYCNTPLSTWLNDSLLHSDFLVYERKDAKVTNETSPWISSWFIVATKHSVMMQTWRDAIRTAWKKMPLPPVQYGYFWMHSIFRKLTSENEEFYRLFEQMPFFDTALPTCQRPLDPIPPIYKISAKTCNSTRERLIQICPRKTQSVDSVYSWLKTWKLSRFYRV